MKHYIKKILLASLVLVMLFAMAASVLAFDDVRADNPYCDAVERLYSRGIVAGVSESLFEPDASVKRWQMALFVARAGTGITDDARWNDGAAMFEDCLYYTGAIQYCYVNGVIKGVDSTHFAPDNNIILRDGIIMAVRALGYEKEDDGVPADAKKYNVTGADYWKPYYIKAVELGLLDKLQTLELDKTMTRGETVQLIYNMLRTKMYASEFTMSEAVFEGKKENTAKNRISACIVETPLQNFGDDTLAADDEAVVIRYADGNNVGYLTVDFETLSDSFIDIYDIEAYFGAYLELVNCPVTNVKNNTINYAKFERLENVDNSNVFECTNSDIGYFTGEDKIKIDSKTYSLDSSETKFIELYTPDRYGKEYINCDIYNDFAGKDYSARFYDLDLDGMYDRGILFGKNIAEYASSSSSFEVCGIMKLANAKNSSYSSWLDTDDIFTYTYNSLLNEVKVIDLVEKKVGKVTGISRKPILDCFGNEMEISLFKISGEEYECDEKGFVNYFVHAEDSTEIEIDTDYEELNSKATEYLSKTVEYYVCGNKLVNFGEIVEENKNVKELIFSKILDTNPGETISAEVYIDGKLKNINIASVKMSGKKYVVNELSRFKLNDLLGELSGLYTYEVDENMSYHIVEVDDLYNLSDYITNKNSLVFNEMTAEDYKSRAKAIRLSPSTVIYTHDIKSGEIKIIPVKTYGVFAISVDEASMFYADKIGYGNAEDGHGVASILYITTTGETFDYGKYKIVYLMDEVKVDEIGYPDALEIDFGENNVVYSEFETSGLAFAVSTHADVNAMYLEGGASKLESGVYVVDTNGLIMSSTPRDEIRRGDGWIDISSGNSMLYRVVNIASSDIDLYNYDAIVVNGLDILDSNYITTIKFAFAYPGEGEDGKTLIKTYKNRELVDYLKLLEEEHGIEKLNVLFVPNKYDRFDIAGTYPYNTLCAMVIDHIDLGE